LAAWTLGSAALYAIAARLAVTRIGARTRASSFGRMVLEGARFVFYVGLPYLALLSGAYAPSDIGLRGSPATDLILGWTPEDWTRALGQAVALGGMTLIATAVLTWQLRRAGGYTPTALGVVYTPIARSIRDGVYAEAHWSFYRALPILLLGDARWAALGGLALVVIEALLAGRRAADGADRLPLGEALLLTLSATYFALTGGNVWLAIALQVGTRVAMTRLAHASRRATMQDEIIV